MKLAAFGLAIALFFAIPNLVVAQEEDPGQVQELDQEQEPDPNQAVAVAHDLRWRWRPEEANIAYCMMQGIFDFQIEIIIPPQTFYEATIRIVKDDKRIYSWRGGPHTVFTQKGNRFVYAEYSPHSSGCTLVCIDLENGQELWKTRLQGIGPTDHSAYSNSVILHRQGESITVYGNEAHGKYVEIVDLKTGKTIALKTFPPREQAE